MTKNQSDYLLEKLELRLLLIQLTEIIGCIMVNSKNQTSDNKDLHLFKPLLIGSEQLISNSNETDMSVSSLSINKNTSNNHLQLFKAYTESVSNMKMCQISNQMSFKLSMCC